MAPEVVLSIGDLDDAGRRRAARGDVAGADVVEVRADRLGDDAVVEAVRAIPTRVIVTARDAEQGGAWNRGADAKLALYRKALDAGAWAVDVEAASPLAVHVGTGAGRLDPARVVASDHGAPCAAGVLDDRLRRLAAVPAARLKLVPRATRLDDVLAVRSVLRRAVRERVALACFATGPSGATSRVLALAWGSWATYGSTAAGRETAPGQVPVADLIDTFDVRRIGTRTRLYGLVGGDLRRSPSPAMHGAALRALAADARYLPLSTDDLDAFERVRVALAIEGVGVTVPHKETAAARCHALDEDAARAGAVNTVRFEGPAWAGSNTDAIALRRALRRHLDVRDRRAVVVGAGGTGRTAAAVLVTAGARVTIVNRDASRAERVARAVGGGIETVPWDALDTLDPDVWVHATPLGRDDEFRLPIGRGRRTRLVVDFVYGPRPTPSVASARAVGIATVDGVELLATQGVEQFAILTGAAADAARFRKIAEAWIAAGSAVGDPHRPRPSG